VRPVLAPFHPPFTEWSLLIFGVARFEMRPIKAAFPAILQAGGTPIPKKYIPLIYNTPPDGFAWQIMKERAVLIVVKQGQRALQL
jgi:hypothetical protein